MEFLESKFLYLGLLIFTIAFPLIYSFESRIKYYKNWRFLFPSILIMMLIFIPWDIYFSKEGIWWFNHDYTMGLDLLYLPIEEWLFFLFIPYSCIFIYESLNYYIKKDLPGTVSRSLYLTLSVFFLAVAAFQLDRIYTLLTFSLAGIAAFITWYYKPIWGGRYLQMYLVSWAPFLLVNGALTGGFTKEAVVNYNPMAFMGIRINTIPIEDSVYNFLMLLIVVAVYERNKSKKGA